jgi:hypothetical protein
MGPGTHIIERLRRGDMPYGKTDAISLLHDIDYIGAMDKNDLRIADDLAINRAGYNLQGITMKLGLSARKLIGLDLAGKRPDVAKDLKHFVMNDPEYRFMLHSYGLL